MTRYDSYNVLMRSESSGIHGQGGDEEDRKQAFDERPGSRCVLSCTAAKMLCLTLCSSTLGPAALLPSFGHKKRSHLPTPQRSVVDSQTSLWGMPSYKILYVLS